MSHHHFICTYDASAGCDLAEQHDFLLLAEKAILRSLEENKLLSLYQREECEAIVLRQFTGQEEFL